MTHIELPFIETDCTFEHADKTYTAGGAVVTDKHIVAYPDVGGKLKDWHGNVLGTWRTVTTWRTPRSYLSPTMSQIEATVGGVVYTGRGAGVGMIYKGKRKVR